MLQPQRQTEDGLPFHQAALPLMSSGLSAQVCQTSSDFTSITYFHCILFINLFNHFLQFSLSCAIFLSIFSSILYILLSLLYIVLFSSLSSSLFRSKRRRECGTYLATAHRHRRRPKMQKRDESYVIHLSSASLGSCDVYGQ